MFEMEILTEKQVEDSLNILIEKEINPKPGR